VPPPGVNQIDLFMHFLGASRDGLVTRRVDLDTISSSDNSYEEEMGSYMPTQWRFTKVSSIQSSWWTHPIFVTGWVYLRVYLSATNPPLGKPSVYSFVAVWSACSHADLVDKGRRLFLDYGTRLWHGNLLCCIVTAWWVEQWSGRTNS
jgi:hypothetical protein